ncbi:Histone deacetylase-like amidohydrolase [Planctomycetes bacterium Pan216]|uniref:Histone deacetylase-like amidohydrolase n=2 Tax=Kolteria novifilia TaxID=2527975 RepID=A0A518B1E3_9BACT|nr:Histone deacetylase-like amidohydrolase [Planctomycetes bacterium Pan216]
MTFLYYSSLFQQHETGAHHPERPARVRGVWQRLEDAGLTEQCTLTRAAPLTHSDVTQVHDEDVVHRLEQMAARGGGQLDADTVMSERSLEAALLAAGSAVSAVDAVLTGHDTNAFCLIRPPGHHATPHHSMGFCLVNNVALAAQRALDHHQLDRILIVDWDVHHGNGTQDVFYEEPRVTFFSSHRFPFYPGTGRMTETGRGDGLGTTFNLPVAYGTPVERYLDRFRSMLDDAVTRCRPDLVLVSAGFDAHRDDPIGSLDLETEHFGALSRLVNEVAREYCQGRLVSLLEGGYNVEALADSVVVHVKELLQPAP